MKKILLAVAVLLLPSLSGAQGLGEILEGITNPQLVAGASYNNDSAQKWNAVLTANVLGPKLGSIPCYIAGVGVGLNTVVPGLEDAPIASWSFPLLSCAPWGERVVLQTGMSTPLNGDGTKSYYFGVGFSVESPNTLQEKRVKRAAAKKAKKAQLEQGPPAPAS
jgi:hypothetical protein